MTSFQQSIDRWSNLLDKPLAAAEPPPVDGIDITDNFGSLISEARAALTDATAAPGSATADQDLIASAAESNKFETMMPDTSWAGLNLREVARGSQQQMSQAAAVIATPSLRAELIQSLMKPAAKIAEWLNPPKTEYELAIQNLTKRNLAQQLSMAVEPAGSGLTASPQDLQSEIIALRGTQQGLSQGQQEGFMGDVSRGVGQSAPSLVVTAGTLATGGALLPMVLASQVTIPMSSYTNSQLAYIDDLEQRRYDQALAGETLSEFDPVEMGRRAEIGAIIETTAEAGGAAFGAKFIGKVAKGVGTSSAARYATNKFAKTGAVKAATEVVRRSGSKAGRLFTAANEGVMNFTPGFIYRGAQVAGISGFEEAGEELFAGIANSPFTYAPLGQDVNDALYSMAVASVSGGASGAASSGGLALREAVVNRNDAFRPETDRERIVRQTHSDAMKARSNWSEGLEQTQRDRIAAKLDTIEGMTPDERGTYVMALADRKAEIIANAEGTLAERQEVDVAMTGAQEVLDKAKAAAGTASPTADQDVYEAEFALLVLQDKAKQLDEQLVLANTDHMIATAEHGAVAEKISDMPATVVRSTPVEVLASVGTRSGVALNETKTPRWGKKIANEMEALGTQVVWYTPADKKSSNPGFHSRRTPGVIYLNAASNQQRVRAVALEEAFHDIQMFRPDIAQAFVDKAGLLPVYDAALEYVSRGGAETAAIERQDEAAFAQAENVAATLEGETSGISPNAARAGAARISQEGEANAFARAMAGIKAKGAMSSLTRLAARSGLMGRESLAAMAVVDRVARAAAVEAVSGKTGDATLSPLARTLMWASDMDVDFARDIPTADRELSEPISPPVAAKPKMDRVAHKREKESGRYVGAPDWVGNSPAQLAKLRFKLRKLAKEGEAGRYWYEDSSRAILEMAGGDKDEAEKIVSLIAIYSPNATVSANTTMALTAYYQFKAGLNIDAGFGAADEKATALLERGQAWGGIKTNSFYQNLMIEIDPSKLDLNVSTMDMWMAIAFDYGDKVLDQGSKYRFAERETARLAQELGWTAHQVQAAIWSAMKGRIDPIRGQLKAEELRLGIGEMVNKVNPKTGKEGLVYEVKKDKKKEHFRLAHKMGMEYDLQDKDINAAKFDFSTALRDRMVQQSYETTPSTASGAPIPGIHTATLDKQFEYQRALYPIIFPDKVDVIAQMVGLPQGATIEGVSAWESKTQTGLQAFAAAPTEKSGKAKKLRPSAVKLLDLASRIRGYVLTQDAVAYHTAIFDDAKIRHNGIQLNTKNALSHQEIELFYRALHEKFNRWDLAPIYRKDGLRVLNFTAFDESQKPVSNKEFKKAFDEIVTSLPDTFGGGIVDSVTFRSDGNLVSNNWSKDKNGEEYLASIERERPDLLQQVRNLRAAAQTVNDQFVAKYGWDKAGVSFARPQRFGIEVVRGRDFSVTARYGTKQKGSVSVLGFHFSRARREVLDSTFYGTGIKDAGSERVRAAKDKRLKNRTFFYVDRGVGYVYEELGVQPEGFLPEGGVGTDMHGVNLRNMYDAIADPLGFVAKGKTKADGNRFWFNSVETAILDAGFDGVYMPNAMSSVGVAVLLGKHKVKVQYLGRRNARTGKMLTKRELQLQESYAREDERDAEYMDAITSGDMDTAQSMVIEAARAAGFSTDKYFHTTRNLFSKFKTPSGFSSDMNGLGIWITKDKRLTNALEMEQYEIAAMRGDSINQPRLLEVFIKEPSNPFRVKTRPELDKLNPTNQSASVIKQQLIEQGFDGIIVEDDYGNGESRVVFNESDISIADPVVNDESGNVVPLSRRFDDANEDISFSRKNKSDADYTAAVKRGDMETAQRMVMEAAKTAGYNETGSHGLASGRLIGDTFDKSRLGTNTGAKSAELGFFFGSRDTAKAYAARMSNEKLAFEYVDKFQKLWDELLAFVPKKFHKQLLNSSLGLQLKRQTPWMPTGLDFDGSELDDKLGLFYDDLAESASFIEEDIDTTVTSRLRFDQTVQESFNKWFKKFDNLTQQASNAVMAPAIVDVVLKMQNPLVHDYKGKKFRDETYASVIAKAKENGHDSVLLLNTFDGGKKDTIKVVFEAEQIKSSSSITYDESGDVVPLSQRFDDSRVEVSYARSDEDQDITALQQEIESLKRLVRDVQNTTAAQRVNALSEVRKLERKLNFMTMLAEQRLGQVNRAKARTERQTALMNEQVDSANQTIASLEAEITAKRDAVAAAKASIKNVKVATKAQTDALKDALLDAERTAERAINWAYQIGRNEGVTAGQVAGQQQAQPLVEKGEQAAAELKSLKVKARKDAQSSKRAIDWAYGIGRNEGLVAGQVAGQQQTRREMRPRMERLARVESLLDISVKRVRELKTIVKTNARSAQRAVNFAYSMGLNKGRMQGIMKGRAEILRKMRKREDTLQNQLFNLRELMNTRIDDIDNRNRIIRKIVSDALLALPAKLRGTLANRAATATTVAQANRVAIEAIRIAINAEVTEGIAAIKKTQKRMNKRGMKWAARQQIEKLLDEANTVLRDANNRKRTAKVVTAKGSPVTLVDAVALYADVIDAAAKVENAAALYAVDRAEYIAERDQRIVRYADLNQRILQNMTGRRMIAARVRADEAARLSLISRVSRANSDIYTLSLELEGTDSGVIDELLRLAQEGKGEASLEHARLMRDLEPALIAAGYEGVDDYRLKNGGYGDGSTELVTVSLGGRDVTIPLGIAMSIAAMDEETLALFDGTNAGKQGIQFRDSATTLTLYPSGADIRTLRANLTDGQRNLIEAMKDILETQIRDRAMEAIWQVEGDQPPIVERYYPRVRNMAGTGGEAVSVAAATGAAVRGALTAVGFANARTGGFTPLVYTDMVQTMDRHMQVALDMIHMAQPYRDAMTVLNNPEVVAAIDGQMGAGTANGVRSIFSNGVGATARTKPTIIDALTSNVTGAKLAMNPSTIAKVLIGGTIRLSSEIPLSLWTRGTARAARYARTPGTWSDRIDQIHLVNGYFARRHQMQMKSIFSGTLGDSDRAQLGNALRAMRDNLRATGANLAARKITDAINSAGDVNRASTMALSAIVDALRYADEQIMLAAVEARLAEVEDEGLLTGTDALTEASNRAERDFRKTQNASDEFDDSYFAATSRTDGNAGWRLLFPFSSDPLKARNQIRRAVLSGNRTRTAFAVGGNIVSGTTISSLSTIVAAKVISLVAGMIGAGDDEDEKEATTKAWWENTLVSLPTQLAGEVMSVTMGYMGIMFANALSSIVYRRSAVAPLVGSPIQEVGNEAMGAFKKDATAIDKMQAIVGGSLATLQYGGIPFYPLYRLVMRSLELGESAAKVEKTPREKLLDSIERKRKSLEKLRSN